MYKKFLLYLLIFIIFVFAVPIIISLIFSSPENNVSVFLPEKELPREKIIVSVLDEENEKVTEEDLEEYLIGVVASEMPASYHIEALKAQAVAARTYIMYKQKTSSHPEIADVCNNPSHCKGYISLEDAKVKWGESWVDSYLPKIRDAVSSTSGEYMTYDGEVIEAFFFALSNGSTEDVQDVFSSPLPYLKAVKCEDDHLSKDFISVKEFTKDEFNRILKSSISSYLPSQSPKVSVLSRTQGGRVEKVKINNEIFKGTDIRSLFSLKSADFSVEEKGDKIVFTTKGNGHGVGMSQYGAKTLAEEGKTYEEILNYYYSDIKIENI